MKNPYNPSFGARPERFLGRDTLISNIEDAMNNMNSPWRETILIGVRGSGKTAILSDLLERFEKKDCIVALATSADGFLDDILGQIHSKLYSHPSNRRPKLKSIKTGFGLQLGSPDTGGIKPSVEVSFDTTGMEENAPHYLTNFESQIAILMEEAKKRERKIVILIDEVQNHSSEMRRFAIKYQHFKQKRHEIMVVVAGLPNAINDILNDNVLTFFRRAERVSVDYVDHPIIQKDYHDVFMKSFPSVGGTIIQNMALATKGYPYLIQLIGYYMWELLKQKAKDSSEAFEETIKKAREQLFKNVHKLVYLQLSREDRIFIAYMMADEATSNIADMAIRLNIEKIYAIEYGSKLIAAGVIKAVNMEEGVATEVTFAFPYMREFMIFIDKAEN